MLQWTKQKETAAQRRATIDFLPGEGTRDDFPNEADVPQTNAEKYFGENKSIQYSRHKIRG